MSGHEWITDRLPEKKDRYAISAIKKGEKEQIVMTTIAVWNGEMFITDLLPTGSVVVAWAELPEEKEALAGRCKQ